MKRTRLPRLALFLIVAGHSLPGLATMSPEASAYLTHALDLMQRYALHRKDLDWPSLRSTAFADAKDAQTLQQTYPAIVFACTQLHDHSSSLIRPV